MNKNEKMVHNKSKITSLPPAVMNTHTYTHTGVQNALLYFKVHHYRNQVA